MKRVLSILIFTISFANLFGQNTEPTIKPNEKSFPTNLNNNRFCTQNPRIKLHEK